MRKRGRPPHPDVLTPAEWRVVEGVRHGLTNPEIAARCALSLDAVKFHVGGALAKLGLSSRRQLRQWGGVRADSALASGGTVLRSPGWVLSQVTRSARRLAPMADWFRDVIGLTEIMRFEHAVFFDGGGVRVYLAAGDPANNSLLYFRVGDIHEELARLRACAVPIVSAPHRVYVHGDGTEE
jgi:DNA-binding CsgD family transcriptional regulator